MSPSWRDQLRIFLAPHQASLVRIRRGWSPRVDVQRTLACTAVVPSATTPWQATLATLATALPEFSSRPGDVQVILSNHFVRYALIPDSDQINSAAEEQALVRHHYTRLYGGNAENWVLRLSDPGVDAGPRLASAVDAGLLQGLNEVFRSGKLTLCSIQPNLMAAFNDLRAQLATHTWFALVEPGRLCLARFEHSQWRALKTIKIGATWLPDLLTLLGRERLLAGIDTTADNAPVYVYAPGCSEITPAQAKEHTLLLLPLAAATDTDSGRTCLAEEATG